MDKWNYIWDDLNKAHNELLIRLMNNNNLIIGDGRNTTIHGQTIEEMSEFLSVLKGEKINIF